MIEIDRRIEAKEFMQLLAIGKVTPFLLIPAGAAEFVVPITEEAGKTTKSSDVAWRAFPKTAPNAAAVVAPSVGVNAPVICALLSVASASLIKIGFFDFFEN